MKHLHDLRVLVLGLGDSGLAMARWCARFGAAVQVWDSRDAPPQADALRAAVPAARLFSGVLAAEHLAGVQLVLKSPGLAPHDARIVPLLDAARANGIAIAGELDLFARALVDLNADRAYAPRVLAITGTNGKTTTTALCAMLVERCGLRVAAAGNIGPTLLHTLAQALDDEPALIEIATAAPADEAVAAPASQEVSAEVGIGVADLAPVADNDADPADDDAPLQLAPPPPAAPVFQCLPEVWVLELSSFQLDGVRGFEPAAASVLNITQDHLDWHGSMDAYAAAKARVFGEEGVMVLNRDDPRVQAMQPAPVLVKGGRGKANRLVGRKVVRFGLDAPQHPGDFGLITENGMAWLVRAREVDETIKRKPRPQGRRDAATVPQGESGISGRPVDAWADEEEILLQRLMPADALRIRGRHNAANALAALALATAIGCPLAPMLHGLREYHGEPHRVEFIASVGGIEAFDDSKGTNVGATVAALDGLGTDKAPGKLLVILGGDGKGQDFSPLAAPTARHARAVALIGRDASAIDAALAADGAANAVPRQHHASLEAAVVWCFEQARAGDAVLLSPACASLDMFRNYGHRAEVFVSAVQALAAERGETV